MNIKKTILSMLLIFALAVTIILPVFADNIILIQDSYYYSDDGQYLTSQCATYAGEPEKHRAVATASSIWETVVAKGNWHMLHSSKSATVYIGNHSDSYYNYYELWSLAN